MYVKIKRIYIKASIVNFMLAVLILCSTLISQTLINVFSGICMYVCMQCTSMLTVSHYVERSVCAKKT